MASRFARAIRFSLRRGIGYVVQETGLFPHFKIERNVGIVLELEGRKHAEIPARSRELMKLVGLDAEKFCGALSASAFGRAAAAGWAGAGVGCRSCGAVDGRAVWGA